MLRTQGNLRSCSLSELINPFGHVDRQLQMMRHRQQPLILQNLDQPSLQDLIAHRFFHVALHNDMQSRIDPVDR